MTERYSFSGDRPFPGITIDNSIVWDPQSQHHPSMYADSVNSSLSDTINEAYVTANEDNTTQYLSVLDTSNEISLENLNLTLENTKIITTDTETFLATDEQVEENSEELNDQQVVVFAVEGSDELYGVQLAQDEDGNIQKYQFQFRKNEDGQLEAIPETIQLLPADEEEVDEDGNGANIEEDNVDVSGEPESGNHSMQIFVQNDNSEQHILPDQVDAMEASDDEEPSMMMYEEDESENLDSSIDIKPAVFQALSVKQEAQEMNVNYDSEHLEEDTELVNNLEVDEATAFEEADVKEAHFAGDNDSMESHQEAADNNSLEDDREYYEDGEPAEAEVEQHLDNQEELNEAQRYIEESSVVESVESAETFELREQSGESAETFELREQMAHIEANEKIPEEFEESAVNESENEECEIGDDPNSTDEDSQEVVEQPESPEKFNSVTKTNILRQIPKSSKEMIIKKDNRLFLYFVHPEKENVDAITLNAFKPVRTNPRSILKSSHVLSPDKNDNDTSSYDERLSKRFARGKEATQARIFHNFISKTTIPQAPVRKNRLPRKQQIKPVERTDEEIVVQEVIICSNGFMQAMRGSGHKKSNLLVTDYVELTDSDEDYDPKRRRASKKTHKKNKSRSDIALSDSSNESEGSVIQIDLSDDEVPERSEGEAAKTSPSKKRRGRSKTKCSDEGEIFASPLKKLRAASPVNVSKKNKFTCSQCSKSLPSLSTLREHMQHHKLTSNSSSQYNCSKCSMTFKNNALLRRHVCAPQHSCLVCRKKFADLPSLNIHKRIHAKEQLCKTTAVSKVSPKKIKQPPKTFKSPRKLNKCNTCGKLCSSEYTLSIHAKSHRAFTCNTCSATFMSRITLETHVRENCVKTKSPQTRRSLRLKSVSAKPAAKLPCDKCSMEFFTYRARFTHQVAKHGLRTPDKKLLLTEKKKSLHKEKQLHGGVAPTRRFGGVYANLRAKLDFEKHD